MIKDTKNTRVSLLRLKDKKTLTLNAISSSISVLKRITTEWNSFWFSAQFFILIVFGLIIRLTPEQRALIHEFALLEKDTPGTIEGLGDIQREKSEAQSRSYQEKSESSKSEEEKPEEKKSGLLARIKNAIFG